VPKTKEEKPGRIRKEKDPKKPADFRLEVAASARGFFGAFFFCLSRFFFLRFLQPVSRPTGYPRFHAHPVPLMSEGFPRPLCEGLHSLRRLLPRKRGGPEVSCSADWDLRTPPRFNEVNRKAGRPEADRPALVIRSPLSFGPSILPRPRRTGQNEPAKTPEADESSTRSHPTRPASKCEPTPRTLLKGAVACEQATPGDNRR